jgi:hypothetical protein
MNNYHFIQPSKGVYTHNDDDDEPFVFEASMDTNPFDMDDPELAYREYLAERFSR